MKKIGLGILLMMNVITTTAQELSAEKIIAFTILEIILTPRLMILFLYTQNKGFT